MHPVSREQAGAWYATVVEPLLREMPGGNLAWGEARTSEEIVTLHYYPNLRQMIRYYPWFAAPVAAYDQVANEALLAGGEITEPLRVAAQRLRGVLGDMIGLWTAAGLLPASAERRDRR